MITRVWTGGGSIQGAGVTPLLLWCTAILILPCGGYHVRDGTAWLGTGGGERIREGSRREVGMGPFPMPMSMPVPVPLPL